MAISEHTFDLELCAKRGIGLKYDFSAHLSILSSFLFLGQSPRTNGYRERAIPNDDLD